MGGGISTDWVQQSTIPKVMLLFAKLLEGGYVEPGTFSSSQNSDRGTVESSSLTILLHFDRAPDLKKINSKLGLAGCPPRAGSQKGRAPRTLKETEVLHKPLYLGNRNPGRLLYIQWNIHSRLTYGSLLPFQKTNMRKRKQALRLIFAINFENLHHKCKECLTGIVC